MNQYKVDITFQTGEEATHNFFTNSTFDAVRRSIEDLEQSTYADLNIKEIQVTRIK